MAVVCLWTKTANAPVRQTVLVSKISKGVAVDVAVQVLVAMVTVPVVALWTKTVNAPAHLIANAKKTARVLAK